ncbi:MAG TPA: MFS transporter [Gaiellaceae bacterium]
MSSDASLTGAPVRALLAGELLSTLGSQMTWLALPWFVLTTSGSAQQMSLVVAAEAGGYALFGVPSGSLVGRLGARRTMLACDAVRAPLIALVPAAHWTGHLGLGGLVAITFAVGALSTPYGAAKRIVVPELLGEDPTDIGRVNAVFQAAVRTTTLAGPALAGVLIGVVGAPSVLVLDAFTYAIAFALVAFFVPRTDPVRTDEPAAGMLDGLRYLRRDRLLGSWTLALVAGDGAFTVIFAALPVLVLSDYGGNPRLAGLLLGAWGAGAVIGNGAFLRFLGDADGLRVVALGILPQAAPLWLLVAPAPVWVGLLALLASGIANGVVNPPAHALLTLRPPPAVRPHVLTALFTASTLAAPAGLLLAGPAFESHGARWVLGVAVAAQTAAAATIAVSSRRECAGRTALAGAGR